MNSPVVLLLVLALVLAVAWGKEAAGTRSNRVIDEKTAALPEATKRRILAMQQSGMPKDAIAKKIAYEAGSEGTARRMLDRLNLEEKRKSYAHQQKQKQAVLKATRSNKRR